MMKFLPKMCKKMEAYAVRNGNLFLLTCVMHFCCNVSAVAFFGKCGCARINRATIDLLITSLSF